jgi:hypothetical protein
MNLIMCPFGAMPNCHGAGGLAGQHRLGARHGASVVFLGVHKILLSVFFGASALTLLDALPKAILGVMLAIAGQELTTTGFLLLVSQSEEVFKRTANNGGDKKLVLRKNVVVAIITAMVIVAMGKTHYAALSGWVAHMIYGSGTEDFIRWCRQSPRIRRMCLLRKPIDPSENNHQIDNSIVEMKRDNEEEEQLGRTQPHSSSNSSIENDDSNHTV